MINSDCELNYYIKRKGFLIWFNECELVQGVGMTWKRRLIFSTLEQAKKYITDNYGKSANIVNNYL